MDKMGDHSGKKMFSVQVHIMHSLIQMVSQKFKYAHWMNERDFVEANSHYFQKMTETVERHYHLHCSMQHSWLASRLYLASVPESPEPDVVQEEPQPPEGEDTFWQDYERIYRLDPDRYDI
ncbi:hypothetical protein CLV98_107152 [Dyadobacter jejuensis]|uniref:Uncharacterized protein n=1 Tax=Dyadobacter jejuensis TaxID=1082580 RepID=A0A316AKA3_9BACT|nr:hypothetical protein [Dyadobacter jejuensis]PWJ57444.1 hypothetical protein CLV98_107152 [Dyadobacter jejuensis]